MACGRRAKVSCCCHSGLETWQPASALCLTPPSQSEKTGCWAVEDAQVNARLFSWPNSTPVGCHVCTHLVAIACEKGRTGTIDCLFQFFKKFIPLEFFEQNVTSSIPVPG
jgi:hypothetical protein